MNKREKQRHTENILIHLMMMCLCGAWHVLVREKASGLVCLQTKSIQLHRIRWHMCAVAVAVVVR